MKFLKEHTSARWAAIGCAVTAAGLSLWLWLTFPGPARADSAPPTGLKSTELSVSATSTRIILPYGSEFKTDLFTGPKYRTLIFSPKLEVKPEELGRDNPFVGPAKK